MATDDSFELGDLALERGGVIPAARLAYRTHGVLSPARDNAILFAHMYSGTQASLDPWIAAERPLDPARWFIICPGQLGNGISSSPSTAEDGNRISASPSTAEGGNRISASPSTAEGGNRISASPSTAEGGFPELTIADDVSAQHRLVRERFGIERLELALGFSMGAQQAYEWAVRFPAMIRRLAVFAGLARTTPANGLLVAAAAEALATGGTEQHAHFWAATGLSAELFRLEAWRQAGFTSVADVVSRLFVEDLAALEPSDLLAQLAKWRLADVSRHADGDLAAALRRIDARTVVAAFSHDNWFPAADCRAEQQLITNSSFRVVESVWGHYAWGITAAETAQIDAILRELLAT